MDPEDKLTDAVIEAYQRGGEEVGYWGRRFLQSVRRKDGLATAKPYVKAAESWTAGRARRFAKCQSSRPNYGSSSSSVAIPATFL
jgi:hypothetical protein